MSAHPMSFRLRSWAPVREHKRERQRTLAEVMHASADELDRLHAREAALVAALRCADAELKRTLAFAHSADPEEQVDIDKIIAGITAARVAIDSAGGG